MSASFSTPLRRPWTLAQRIALLALIPTALVLSSGGLWLRTQMHGALYESFAQVLHEQQERVAARLRITHDSVAEPAAGAEVFSAIYSGWYWQATAGDAPDAQVIGRSRSLWDAPPIATLQPAGPSRLGLMQARGPLQEPLLGSSSLLTMTGLPTPARLIVLAPAHALNANLQRIDHILLASAAALFVLLAVMLLIQVRVGLAPLRRLTQAIAAQRLGAPAPRLDELPAGADLAPLQQELTALLAYNKRVVSRARAHAVDLNHALKKPLALLTANASQQRTLPATEVMQHITAMTRLIDRYQARTLSDALHHAHADLPGTPVQPCLTELLQAMRKLHAAQDLQWQLTLPPAASAWHWRGDRTDLEEILGNLLDNAGKWAASQVQISAHAHATGQLCIDIEDDGPGMGARQLQAAGQRGLRFDETVEGSGLGLAIASQIAQAYGGELILAKSPALKGLHAQIRLTGLLNTHPPHRLDCTGALTAPADTAHQTPP